MGDMTKGNYMFLLCSERSGSNFITKLMNNHSQVVGPSTKHIINPLARNYFRYQPYDHNNNWDNLIDNILELFEVKFSVWQANFNKREIKENVKIGDIKGLITYFFDKELSINNKRFAFIKEIKVYEFYPFLKAYFPYSKFVYQVRDPRDMALSWKKNITHRGGVVSAAKQWKTDQQQFLKINALEEVKNNIVRHKYEELVSNPEPHLSKVLSMLGLNYEENMLNMGRDQLTIQNAMQQKAWENLSKPIIKNNFNKYKEQLSEMEIKMIERICFFEMNHLNYQTENTWDSLSTITNKEVNDFQKMELDSIKYEPVKGVIENMKAKKNFYEYGIV